MTFGAPLFFWALALIPVLLALFARNELSRRKLVEQLVASRLLDSLAGSVSPAKRRLRFLLFLLGLTCLILALTRPQVGYRTEEHKVTGKDVLIAIDTSRSMLANDVSPSRLARAKFAAEDLITQLRGDRVGLIAFAGTAFLQAPLTADYSAVLDSLHELDTNVIPVGGTDIAEAIRAAAEAFGAGESDNRALILFTDGEELDEDAVAAAKALKGGIHIYTVGIGTTDGTVIALPGAGAAEYIKSPEGEIVKSRLDEPRLRAIAEAAGGFYVHLNSGPAEMQQIIAQGLNSLNPSDKGVEITRRPLEQYQWPLGVGLILLLLSRLPSERRVRASGALPGGIPATAAALLLFLLPPPASAKNAGVEAYEREDYNKAKETFEKQLGYLPDSDKLQFDLGSAAYKTGDLDQALTSFSKALTSKDQALREKTEYNLGNTLFRRGAIQKEKDPKLKDWKNSLQHYDEALKAQPKDADAKYNRDLVQHMIEELEKEPPKSDQKKDDQKKQDQKDQKKQNQQDQNSGQKQNQQKQDQQDQKGQQQQQQQGQSKDQQDQPQQGQQSKDQQAQQQQGQQSKDQQAQQQQGQQSKDQQQQQSKDQQAQQQQGQQPKDQQGQEGKDQQAQQQPQPAEQQPGPEDSKQPDHKHTGQITDAQKREADEKQEAAQEAEAAAKGEMTPAQAATLLDSVKDDAHLAPLNPRNPKPKDRNLRDW